MSWTTKHLTETLTRWVRGTPDGFGGFSSWTKSNIKGRWEQRTELFVDPAGNQVMSRAVVYVDTDVSLGDYLFQGNSTGSDPANVSDAYEVRDFKKVSTLGGSIYERKVML